MTGVFSPYMASFMTTRKNLIYRIDRYLAATGKSATKLCSEAGVDHHVISKLRQKESITLRSIERLEETLSLCQLCDEVA